MLRTGLMGGTFDPIHLGHLLAAEAAREAAQLDEVWFIPTAVPPHKPQPGASGEARLAMAQAAVAGHPAFRALDLELARGGVSYTVDTVSALRERYPDRAFYWLVGTDMMNDLPNWRRIEELAEMVTFVCLSREGERSEAAALPAFLRERLLAAPMPKVGISSTDIRRRRREGRSIRYQVPEAAREYIERNGLYES